MALIGPLWYAMLTLIGPARWSMMMATAGADGGAVPVVGVTVSVLGATEVHRGDGAPVRLGGVRVRTLLVLLALEPGHVVSTDRLVDILWGEDPPANASNALQTLVKRLRAVLGSDLVARRSVGYVLALEPEAVDACRFTELVADARTAREAGDDEQAMASFRSALALWRGPALADVPALSKAATHLTELWLTAVEDWAELHLRIGRSAEIVNELAGLVEGYPLRERLCGIFIRVLGACGRQADALMAFQRTRRMLAEELGVDPCPELAEAHLAVLRAENRAGGPGASNLRAQLTSFVGRDEEIAGIAASLAQSRLVTLVGPGGAGKTRLAVETASRTARRWPDGAWLIELAGVVDAVAVPYAMLAAMGIRDNVLEAQGPMSDAVERISRVLAGKRLLLIVDNCEHVLDTVAPLIDGVLARCPGVAVLAASREPLGITGETLKRVPPLAVPPGMATAAEVPRYPAVRLFTDRARSVRADFTVNDGNHAVVGAICRRLDGMPLAIELAAARLKALTPDQIADRLDDRFRLLTGGNRAALPRHQTLRAVVDWSWGLLSDPERELARRLSVFAGGMTLESAEQVCGGEVLDALVSLVDKSLVEAEDGRFRMLETIRAYGAEQLARTGEMERISRAHAHSFLDLAEAAVAGIRTAEQPVWVRRLADDHDNLVAALGWAVRTGEVEVALRLCGALTWYWELRGYRAEATYWGRHVLALVGDDPPAGLMGAYLACEYATGLTDFVGMVGFDEAIDRASKSERIRQRLSVAFAEGGVHPIFRIVAAMPESLDDSVGSSDPWLANTALLMRGSIRMNRAQHDGARRDLEAAVSGFRRLGEWRGLCRALLTLATFRTRADGVGSATALVEEAASAAPAWAGAGESVSILVRLAHLQAWDNDLPGGTRSLARARGKIAIGVPGEVLIQLRLTEADLLRRRGEFSAALPIYEEVIATLEAAQRPVALDAAWARTSYSMALAASGDLHRAHTQLRQALDLAEAARDLPVLIAVLTGYARAALAAGDTERALTIIEASAPSHDSQSRGGPDVAFVRACARAELGEQRYAELVATAVATPTQEIIASLRDAGIA